MTEKVEQTPAWARYIRDAVMGLDEAYRISWANPGAELLFSPSTGFLVGASFKSLVSEPEVGEKILEDLAASRESEFPCLIEIRTEEGFLVPLEVIFFRNEGGIYDLAVAHPDQEETGATEVMAVQALHLSSRLSGVQEQVHELSRELLDKTLQLAEERNKSQAVLASMGEGLLVVDREGIVRQINEAACRILDVAESETLGKALEDSPIGSKRSSLATLINNSQASSGFHSQGPARLQLHEKVIELTLAPILEKGGEVEMEGGTVINLRDVTQRAEADRMKTELISIVSHELRAPLANLTGYIDLVLNDPKSQLSGEQLNFLQVAHRNGLKLSKLIDDMLDLSRLESGKIEMSFADTDLEFLVNFSHLSFRKEAEDKNLELTKRILGNVHVQGDGDRLGQVLDNLVSNAIKYTPAGGRVEILCESRGDEVALVVSDTGIGISPEDQEKLFQRFFRVRSSETRKIGGTGLGLSIAKTIVDAHRGRLTVESSPGKGSRFTVVLPAWNR